MPTEPTICDEIDPAVTHSLAWGVAVIPHTSENYQIGFRGQLTSKDIVQHFVEFLAANNVTPFTTPTTDGIYHLGQWASNDPENPDFASARYRLYFSGIGDVEVFGPSGFTKQFNNLEPIAYFGNTQQGYVVQCDNGTIAWSANSFAALAMLAIDHVKAKVCAAYPNVQRVLPAPPIPLTEGPIDLRPAISVQTSFKLFFEYSGPDGKISTTIDLPYMWAYAEGKTVAQLKFEDKPYLTTAQTMLQHYGSQPVVDFFFNRNMPWPPMPGDYKLLIYPLRNGITGSARTPWGNTEEACAINISGEFAAFQEYSHFDSPELYLFNHKWTIKNLKLVATSYRIELNTTGNPPGRSLESDEAPWLNYYELIVSYASVGTYQHPQAPGGDAHFYWGSEMDGQDPLFDSAWYFSVPLGINDQATEIEQFALYAQGSITQTVTAAVSLDVDCTAIGGGRPMQSPASYLRWPDLQVVYA